MQQSTDGFNTAQTAGEDKAIEIQPATSGTAAPDTAKSPFKENPVVSSPKQKKELSAKEFGYPGTRPE